MVEYQLVLHITMNLLRVSPDFGPTDRTWKEAFDLGPNPFFVL